MDKIGQLLERGFFGGIVLAAAFAGAADVRLKDPGAGVICSGCAWRG